jgi:hypothetical protein
MQFSFIKAKLQLSLKNRCEMQVKTGENYFLYSSPISVLEELFFQFQWSFERSNENEIAAELEGRWCNYQLFALWRPDLECLIISSLIDIKIPQDKYTSVGSLLSAMNPRIWLGHFEISPDDEVPAFRYNLILRGNPGATIEQLEEIVSSAVTECDRLYPALQFVLWGGKSPEDALMAAMLDTFGEA